MTEQFVRKMEEGVKLLGIQLSEKQLEQFYDYFQFLVEKNKSNEPDGHYRRRCSNHKAFLRQSVSCKRVF